MINLEQVKFNADGLVPAVVQDVYTHEVLMLAYMNLESLQKTLLTGKTCFWSRSRQELWTKGETSGHYQLVKEIFLDCDGDTLLIKVEQVGNTACHTGERSCFHHALDQEGRCCKDSEGGLGILEKLFHLIGDRKINPPEKSYVAYLFEKGQDKILKKVGEEAAEVIIASKNNNSEEIIYELADLYFHTLVLLQQHGLELKDIYQELEKRKK